MVKLNFSTRLALCGFLVIVVAIGYDGYVKAIPFNLFRPDLTTNWFQKPGPTESIFLGLILLKVLALRLAGVFPYNLNNLLDEGSFLDKNVLGGWDRKKRTQRDLFSKSNKFSKALLFQEMEAVERILLGLRRIDSHDCFIRHVCQVNQKRLIGKSTSYDEAVLKIFSIKSKKTSVLKEQKSILDIYGEALRPEVTDCNKKYRMCPLTKKDMKVTNLLSGMF